MFLWFAGGAFVAVWLVFRSPAVDYRLVVLGALLPLVELPIGEPRILHSLTAAVAALGLAMLVTPRRRMVQRRLVANDALRTYIRHETSALFVMPGGVATGGYLGQGLLEST